MTASEAITFMKLFREEWDKNSKTRNAKALDIAIQALEKQIPKKPKKNTNSNIYFCPVCERKVAHNHALYCSGCGQKLDWGKKMRLISAGDLKDRASEYCLSEDEFRRFCKIIDEEPTAYDIDSVVEQLEECISDTSNTITGIAAEWAYKGAIEIVKAGQNNGCI